MMMENLMAGLVPVMLARVGAVSETDKRHYAQFLNALTGAYLENDRQYFEFLIQQVNWPDGWQTSLVKALWPNGVIGENKSK